MNHKQEERKNSKPTSSTTNQVPLKDRYVAWQRRLKIDLYNSLSPKVSKYKDHISWKLKVEQSVQSKEKEVLSMKYLNQAQIFSSYLKYGKSTEQRVIDRQPPNLPHGYYSSYIPIQSICQLPDQMSWYIDYLEALIDKCYYRKRSQIYEQIGNKINEIDNKSMNNPEYKSNKVQIFDSILRYYFKRYMCPLDASERMNIYFISLNNGSGWLFTIFDKLELCCEQDVFLSSIFKCQKYNKKHRNKLNQSSKIVSLNRSQEMSGFSISKSMKTLYCPMCCIYDCGVHYESSNTPMDVIQNSISFQNQPNRDIMALSAMLLIAQYNLIKSKEREISDQKISNPKDHCSFFCYQRLNCIQDIQRAKKRCNTKNRMSPYYLNLINLGVGVFNFSPCLLWRMFNEADTKTVMTCDFLFLYLVQYYGIFTKVKLNFYKSQPTYLRNITKIQQKQNYAEKHRFLKKIPPGLFSKDKFGICHHHFLDRPSVDEHCTNCACYFRGYCRRQCLCSSLCPLKKGCDCARGQCATDKCPCNRAERECMPGLCSNCFTFENKQKSNRCNNNAILCQKPCLLRIGKSTIPGAGMGIFAGQKLKAKQFVCVYQGESIDTNVELIRQSLRKTQDFYNFGNQGGSIDARFVGNKARFINHGNEPKDNLETKVKLVNGVQLIYLVTKKEIPAGKELLFNYDGSGDLFKNHKEKYPYIKARRT